MNRNSIQVIKKKTLVQQFTSPQLIIQSYSQIKIDFILF